MKVFNLKVPNTRNNKTYYNDIGVMFAGDDGKVSLRLHMFPDLTILAYPRETKEYQQQPSRRKKESPINSSPAPKVFDDQIPF